MNRRLAYLVSRRLELVDKIEVQRMDVAEISSRWRKPFAVADTGLKLLHLVYRHRALFVGGVTLLLGWRRQSITSLARSGWRLLNLYPSAISFGLQYLASVIHFSKTKRD